jgi:hypothetical protein
MTYILMDRSAYMPSSCWGRYRRLAIVELTPDFVGEPKMISERARGVKRIVEERDKLHAGGGNRTAHAIAKRDMQAEVDRLNRPGERP